MPYTEDSHNIKDYVPRISGPGMDNDLIELISVHFQQIFVISLVYIFLISGSILCIYLLPGLVTRIINCEGKD